MRPRLQAQPRSARGRAGPENRRPRSDSRVASPCGALRTCREIARAWPQVSLSVSPPNTEAARLLGDKSPIAATHSRTCRDCASATHAALTRSKPRGAAEDRACGSVSSRRRLVGSVFDRSVVLMQFPSATGHRAKQRGCAAASRESLRDRAYSPQIARERPPWRCSVPSRAAEASRASRCQFRAAVADHVFDRMEVPTPFQPATGHRAKRAEALRQVASRRGARVLRRKSRMSGRRGIDTSPSARRGSSPRARRCQFRATAVGHLFERAGVATPFPPATGHRPLRAKRRGCAARAALQRSSNVTVTPNDISSLPASTGTSLTSAALPMAIVRAIG